MIIILKSILLITTYSALAIGVLLLPCWVAYASSKKFTTTVKNRIQFSLVCTVLTYGLSVFSAFPLIPFESFNIFISPIIFNHGNKNIAYGVNYFIEYIFPLLSIIVWFICSIVIPGKLKPSWIILTKTTLQQDIEQETR